MLNKEIHSANKSWRTWSESKSDDSVNSDGEDSVETKSLPPNSSKEWHPTVPKPFSFTLRCVHTSDRERAREGRFRKETYS